jgi:hypothetical protein
MEDMKRRAGKLICALGILMLYPLSGVLAPWVTRTLFSHKMPDGQIVILNVNAGVKGLTVCLAAGILVLLIGIAVEILQLMKTRKINPNEAPHGTTLPRRL